MSIYPFSARTLSGEDSRLGDFAGKVLLIVNTASECGFTPQYRELQTLYERYRDRGFEVLGFPCNQFGQQEPGSAAEIGAFCERKYSVTFPLFEKIDVNGEHAHPLFRHLKHVAPGLLGTEAIKWNFTKFLVDRTGSRIKRYGPRTKPLALTADIESLLAQ